MAGYEDDNHFIQRLLAGLPPPPPPSSPPASSSKAEQEDGALAGVTPSGLSTGGNAMHAREQGSSDASGPEATPKPKRTRLALSCNRCRSRKIRCDTTLPRCGPCRQAEVDCVTTKPNALATAPPAERRRTGKVPTSSATSPPLVASASPTGGLQGSTHAQPLAEAETLSQMPFLGSSTTALSGPSNTSTAFSGTQPLAEAETLSQMPFLGSSTTALSGPSNTSTAFSGTSILSPSYASSSISQPTTMQPTFGLPTSSSAHAPTATPEPSASASKQDEHLIHSHDHRRKFIGTSSSQVLVKWLDQASTGVKVVGHLKHGLSFSEELFFDGLDDNHLVLPPEPSRSHFVDGYFRTAHLMFPILDEAHFRQHMRDPTSITAQREGMWPLLYLVISIGADSICGTRKVSDVGQSYFERAWKLLPTILARPFLNSAQALLLFAIAFRARNKDGMSWSMCGFAVRVCQSLGLHRHTEGPQASLEARVWYSAYCFDKLLSFFSGRPSAINDEDCVVPLAAFDDAVFRPEPGADARNVLRPLSELAILISDLSKLLFSRKSISLSPVDVLETIGQCDLRLATWLESVPVELRPAHNRPAPGPFFPFAAFIQMVYHQVLITLHRLSLFDNAQIVLPNLTDPRLKQYANRLRSSEAICVESARAILSTLDSLSVQYPDCRHWTLDSCLTAVFVLYIHTWKHAASWQAKADAQLLNSAGSYIKEHYLEIGMDPRFVELLTQLQLKIESKLANPTIASRAPSPVRGATTSQNTLDDGAFEAGFLSTEVTDLWPYLYGPGFSNPLDMQALLNFDLSGHQFDTQF